MPKHWGRRQQGLDESFLGLCPALRSETCVAWSGSGEHAPAWVPIFRGKGRWRCQGNGCIIHAPFQCCSRKEGKMSFKV